MRKRVTIIGGLSGLGLTIAENLSSDQDVIQLSRRNGFDIRYDPKLHDCDSLVISLKVREVTARDQIETEIMGVAAVMSVLPSDCKNVVMLSSGLGHSVGFDQSWDYHASKAALEQLVRYFAVTLGPIRVNAVSPGLVERDPDGKYEDFNNFLGSYLPFQRMVRPQDVAEMVRFLLIPDCPLTGQVLTVDGGASLFNIESLLGRVHQDRVYAPEGAV